MLPLAKRQAAARRMRELHPNMGRETMRRTHELYPDMARVAARTGGQRVNELYPDIIRKNLLKGPHTRWHVQRGIVNPKCKLCKNGGVVTF